MGRLARLISAVVPPVCRSSTLWRIACRHRRHQRLHLPFVRLAEGHARRDRGGDLQRRHFRDRRAASGLRPDHAPAGRAALISAEIFGLPPGSASYFLTAKKKADHRPWFSVRPPRLAPLSAKISL